MKFLCRRPTIRTLTHLFLTVSRLRMAMKGRQQSTDFYRSLNNCSPNSERHGHRWALVGHQLWLIPELNKLSSPAWTHRVNRQPTLRVRSPSPRKNPPLKPVTIKQRHMYMSAALKFEFNWWLTHLATKLLQDSRYIKEAAMDITFGDSEVFYQDSHRRKG